MESLTITVCETIIIALFPIERDNPQQFTSEENSNRSEKIVNGTYSIISLD